MIHPIYKKIPVLLLFASFNLLSFGQSGTAPVNPPTGGFNIDGFIQRQSAGGDWLAGPGGNQTGTFVFSNIGIPLIPLSYSISDLYNDFNDNVFSKGNLNGNPNGFKWTFKRAQTRTDINRCLFFITKDPTNGHTWAVLNGDRRGSNGSSAIDFEFLQNPLLVTGNPVQNGTGDFISYGPHGGRTIGDLVISVGLDGVFSTIKFYQWQPDGNGGYSYLPPLNGLQPGVAFGAFNSIPIKVPYGGFGDTTYPTATFAEVAVDMTALAGGPLCINLANNFRTVFVKSKQTNGNVNNFDDFVSPINLPLSFDYTLSADVSFIDLFTAQLTASVSPGAVSDYNFHWNAVGALINDILDPTITGTLDNYNIYNPVFTTEFNYNCTSYLYEVTIARKDNPGCIVARTPVVIGNPCKIGKPINPDRPNLERNEIRDENVNNEIRVYPNPNKGTAIILLPDNSGLTDVELFDMKGSVVQRWQNISTQTIEFKNVQTGLYLLKVNSHLTGKAITKKIIVNR